MLESQALKAVQSSTRQIDASIGIGLDGRISVPGFPQGLLVENYLPLLEGYARILEASRILDRHRNALRLNVNAAESGQAPLTDLQASRLMPHLYYKREDQTIIRAYKVRGAVVGMTKLMESFGAECFVTVSTGNHALGVLKAAELLRPASVRIVAPENTAQGKLEKINTAIAAVQALGVRAELCCVGYTFDDARVWAMENQREGEAYLDPYSDPWVVAGQGTLGLELAAQIAALLQKQAYSDVIVVSPVGGGGLLSGTATALKMASAWEPLFRAVDFRFVGLQLEDLNAQWGDAIRVTDVAPANAVLLQTLQASLLPMSDLQMEDGMLAVKSDIGAVVEGASGGAAYPAFFNPAFRPSQERLVISILSGANTSTPS